MRHILSLFIACFPLLASAASVTGVSISTSGGVERVVFGTDGQLEPLRKFTLESPDRAVVDVPTVRALGVILPESYKGTLIKGIRFGQYDAETSRLVIDLSAPARIVKVEGEDDRLVVELKPTGEVAAPAAVPKPQPKPEQPKAAAPKDDTKVESPFEAMNKPVPESNKPLVVIDAGHGGQDPGAPGYDESREKDVTLAMAKAVKQGLLRTGRYRVLLTRETDTFIPLQGRVDIARKAKADIFISLHADSAPKKDAKGLSVYTLSENASDDEAAALADRENKSDIIAGLDLGTADEDVASILIDLTQRETMNKSARLADTVVESLHPKITRLPRTHRFAGFRVLKAPDIPSLLIEMGFISNAEDEKLLRSEEFRDLFVASLVKALDAYEAKK